MEWIVLKGCAAMFEIRPRHRHCAPIGRNWNTVREERTKAVRHICQLRCRNQLSWSNSFQSGPTVKDCEHTSASARTVIQKQTASCNDAIIRAHRMYGTRNVDVYMTQETVPDLTECELNRVELVGMRSAWAATLASARGE